MTQQGNSLDAIRTDLVGSFLRPSRLKETHFQRSQQQVSEEELRRVQDQAIRDLIAREEVVGLPVVCDGEFRRDSFMDSFTAAIAGINLRGTVIPPAEEAATPHTRGDDPTFNRRQLATERLRLVHNLVLDEFKFAQALTSTPVKVTLIGPGRIMQLYDPESDVYSGMDEFLADVVAIERQIIGQVVEAGCRYVQVDEPSYTAYVDNAWIQAMKERGEDLQAHLDQAIAADNAVMSGFPGVTFGVHVCRGNRQSMYHREGAYDAIAERLFEGLDCQRLLLEYDTPRAGTFDPLRFVPAGKVAVLGLVSSKVPDLEEADALKRRLAEAEKFLPLGQMALSPQCGFASGIAGNLLGEEDQWRKLELIEEVAADVWS
ncbi:MAG: 5-methyltetrahydropteroyltriglutamate--homocysteine methyltransferase [Chloroflexi bacterium]|jgi:5-methyltetrahydropteroyltriglutamate--homocysteine methyltransferase|nr:MAG: 5-methyltetrahydropteroyltriglutamate--homocysteine methyltransferase [Chloroflexota bacterium]